MASETASSLLELVGDTPLVELPRLSPKPEVRLFAKLEGQNPTGSIKDRVAVAMVEAAERAGELEPGRELLEPTSGNTGISLALVARLKGYRLTCVMPANVTEERRRLLRLYGAEIVESPPGEGSNGAVRLALELAEREPRYHMLFQYGNDANPGAHYDGTGAEIAEALDRVDVLVAGLGTGGTLMGAGARVRESFPDVVVAAAEPLPGDPVMGLRSLEDGYVPPVLDVSKLDRKVLVSNAEAVAGLRALLDREGVFAGVSAGAVVHVARKLADELDEGVVVAILADAGWKYLSAPFWDAERPGGRDGGVRLVVIGAEIRGGAGAARAGRGAERGLRARRRSETAWPSATSRPRTPPPARIASSWRREPENWFLEDEGYELAVFHSHVSSPPRPSRTDVENIGLWEGRPYLILSLGTGELAAWRIAGGEVSPLALEPLRT